MHRKTYARLRGLGERLESERCSSSAALAKAVASHRPKCEWIRKNPRLTILLVNPKNPYH
jgi:hypothetical protein